MWVYQGIFLLTEISRVALVYVQLPILLILRGLFPKGKMTASSKDANCPSFNAKVCAGLILPLPHIFS